MDAANFDKPSRLESLSLIVATAFLPLSIISAIIWPVSGFALWGKGVFTGLVFLGIWASFRKRRKDAPWARQQVSTTSRSDPEADPKRDPQRDASVP